MKTEKYYVSGVREYNDGNCETCADESAQFWTVYERDSEGLSRALCDCDSRTSAEIAARRLNILTAERDALHAKAQKYLQAQRQP